MLKVDFFKKLGLFATGLAGIAAAARLESRSASASPATNSSAPSGLWQMTATGKLGTYKYLYAFSAGAYTCTGNIDQGFGEFAYSPTLGTCEPASDGTYRFVERGWAFNRKGDNVGTFQSRGTFKLDASGRSLLGTGTFTQRDLKGKDVFVEPFTASATRLAP